MRTIHFPLAALVLGIVLSANTCSDKNGAADAARELAGTKWVLQQLNGKNVEMPGEQEKPYLTMDSLAQHVNGFAGCNRMFGPVRVWGDSIAFSELAATRMYCVETQHIEDEFMDALNKTRTFGLKADELILRNGTDLAVLRRAE